MLKSLSMIKVVRFFPEHFLEMERIHTETLVVSGRYGSVGAKAENNLSKKPLHGSNSWAKMYV